MKLGLLRFGRVHRERVRERAMVAQLARFLMTPPGEMFAPRAVRYVTATEAAAMGIRP